MQHSDCLRLAGILFLLENTAALADPSYRVTHFKDLPNTIAGSDVVGINDAGQATGNADVSGRNPGVYWVTPGAPALLQQPAKRSFTLPVAINNAGTICGTAGWPLTSDPGSLPARGTYWENNVPKKLPAVLGGVSDNSFSECYALSEYGSLVGDSDGPGGLNTATLWTIIPYIGGEAVVTTNLGGLTTRPSEAFGISPNGVYIVGLSDLDDFHGHATLWQNRVIKDLGTLSGGNISRAFAVNNQGVAVGNGTTATPEGGLPVIWQNGQISALPAVMEGPNNIANSINSAGDIVGVIDVPTQAGNINSHGALWLNGALIDLDTLLKPLLPTGAVVVSASSIRDSGRFLIQVDGVLPEYYLVTPKYATQVALTSSSNPAYIGTSVTFTATVTSPGHSTPFGAVTFKDGSTTLGKADLSVRGTASFSTANLAVGTHSIVASFALHDVYDTSTSAVLSQRMMFKLVPIPPR